MFLAWDFVHHHLQELIETDRSFDGTDLGAGKPSHGGCPSHRQGSHGGTRQPHQKIHSLKRGLKWMARRLEALEDHCPLQKRGVPSSSILVPGIVSNLSNAVGT